jgi:ketosteroid isomerase-like protein
MTEAEMVNVLHDFAKSIEKSDIEKALSYLTDDAVWTTPNGTSKGKDELKRLLSSESMRGVATTETGNGIMVQGDKAFFEHILEATYQGRKAKWWAMCAYEFNGNKIQHIRTAFDRLSLAQQVTSGLPRMIVNQVIKQSEKMSR